MTGLEIDASSLLKPSVIGGLALLRARWVTEPNRCWDSILKLVAASYEGQLYDLATACWLHKLVQPHLTATDDIYRGAIRTVAETNPPWLDLLCDGREALAQADSSLVACFERAGAMVPIPDSVVIGWWNDLVKLAYRHRESGNLDTGRDAERLCLEREQCLLSGSEVPPIIWTALDTNTAGYDIHSWQLTANGWIPKLIEVKALSRIPSPIFVTRHEWESAKRMSSAYCFQIWDMNSQRIVELTTEEMSVHVPEDHGLGQWNQVEITLPTESFGPA